MRELPPIEWRAVLVGGAVAAAASLLLSIASQDGALGGLGAAAIAAGAAVAGRLASARGAFHGGLVSAVWIAAEALSEPFRPAAPDVASDLARTVASDAVRIAVGVVFGWLGGGIARAGVGGGHSGHAGGRRGHSGHAGGRRGA